MFRTPALLEKYVRNAAFAIAIVSLKIRAEQLVKKIDKKKPELAIYSHHAGSGYVREVSLFIIL